MNDYAIVITRGEIIRGGYIEIEERKGEGGSSMFLNML